MPTRKHLISVLCAKSWSVSCWRTTGIKPLTSPPLFNDSTPLAKMAKRPIAYFRLHGLEGQPYLYSDPGWSTAVSANNVRVYDWSKTTVFLEGCHGAMIAKAFLESGAKAVIGSTKSTWGKKYGLGPSSKVGKAWLELFIEQGLPAGIALEHALKTVPPPFNQGWFCEGNKGALIV